MTSSTVLQLHQREVFERNVTRAIAFGAGAGILHLALQRVGAQVVPFMYLAMVATCLSMVRGDRFDKLLLAGLSFALPAVAFMLDVSTPWKVGLGGALAGALMVRAHQCERGGDNQVGGERPGTVNHLIGAALAAAMALGGMQVAQVFGARLTELQTPTPIVSAVIGATLTLFLALPSIAAHLALRPDPVEARCEELIPRLSGEFQTLSTRALTLYRQCGESLAQLPREPAREELAKTLGRMTRGAVELASDWAGVEAQLEDHAQKNLQNEVDELEKSAKASTDLIARRQLEGAAASLREEVQRLEELKSRRERILARLKAEVALLERARVSLISVRSGHTQLKAAELSAMARKFAALSTLQSDEAKLADAVAANAVLSHDEAAKATAKVTSVNDELAKVVAFPAPAPLTDATTSEAAPQPEREKA